jgi:large subunit ribosomal protein L11
MIIPVVISVYKDRSFSFVTKSPPAAVLLLKAAGLKKGSGEPNKNKVGTVTEAQVRDIAEMKIQDLNTDNIESASNSIRGTARSMGLIVE